MITVLWLDTTQKMFCVGIVCRATGAESDTVHALCHVTSEALVEQYCLFRKG